MSATNKQQDRHHILIYLEAHPICSVDAIREKSGAEPLRIYPLLFELTQEKRIQVLGETELGAPVIVGYLG